MAPSDFEMQSDFPPFQNDWLETCRLFTRIVKPRLYYPILFRAKINNLGCCSYRNSRVSIDHKYSTTQLDNRHKLRNQPTTHERFFVDICIVHVHGGRQMSYLGPLPIVLFFLGPSVALAAADSFLSLLPSRVGCFAFRDVQTTETFCPDRISCVQPLTLSPSMIHEIDKTSSDEIY